MDEYYKFKIYIDGKEIVTKLNKSESDNLKEKILNSTQGTIIDVPTRHVGAVFVETGYVEKEKDIWVKAEAINAFEIIKVERAYNVKSTIDIM